MDGEEPSHGGAGRAPGTPQPCQPHRSAPLAVGPELGTSQSPTSTEGQSLAQGRCSGGQGQSSWHKAGESGHPAPRLVIWSVNMAGGSGPGQEGQWQRVYIKIKGEEGRKSERERARSWLQDGYISLATSSLSATPLDRELWPSFSLFTL